MFEKFSSALKRIIPQRSAASPHPSESPDHFDVPMAWNNVLRIFDREIQRTEESLKQDRSLLDTEKLAQIEARIIEARQSLENFRINYHPQTEQEVRDLDKTVYEERKRFELYDIDRELILIAEANEKIK